MGTLIVIISRNTFPDNKIKILCEVSFIRNAAERGTNIEYFGLENRGIPFYFLLFYGIV
jgi:hypothetical protein